MAASGDAEAEIARARHQVVALDVSDLGVETEPFGEGADRVGQACRVQSARVRDDPHTLVERSAEALLELGQKRLGVAAVGGLGPVASQNQHGQLGEVIAGEVVEVTAGEHFAHRRVPVAVKPRAVSDAYRRA